VDRPADASLPMMRGEATVAVTVSSACCVCIAHLIVHRYYSVKWCANEG
jgi:hypothetical protein